MTEQEAINYINFAASIEAQSARPREILERIAEENRSAEILRRLRPISRTHRPQCVTMWTADEHGVIRCR